MLGRRVADVPGELPARVQRVSAVHEAVTRHLRDDRGGGDRGARSRRPRRSRAARRASVADREAVGQADAARAGRRRAARRAARRGSSCAARARRSCARSARRRRPSAAVRMTIGKSSSRTSCVCCLESLRRLSARSSRVVERLACRTARRRRRAGRPGSRGRPRRRPRPSGRRGGGRTRTGAGRWSACARPALRRAGCRPSAAGSRRRRRSRARSGCRHGSTRRHHEAVVGRNVGDGRAVVSAAWRLQTEPIRFGGQ